MTNCTAATFDPAKLTGEQRINYERIVARLSWLLLGPGYHDQSDVVEGARSVPSGSVCSPCIEHTAVS